MDKNREQTLLIIAGVVIATILICGVGSLFIGLFGAARFVMAPAAIPVLPLTPTTAVSHPPPLDGTEWVLVSLNGRSPLPESRLTLLFSKGEVTGYSGCNWYDGAYTVTPSSILAIPEIASTAQDCPEIEGVMAQEAAFQEALWTAAGYHLQGDQLAISNAEEKTTLVFEPKAQSEMLMETAVSSNASPPLIDLPPASPTATATATLKPSPTPVATSDLVPGWLTYETALYTFSYPPEATIRSNGVAGFLAEELPADMTEEAYLNQLKETYPGAVCVRVNVGSGFVTFQPSAEAGGSYIEPCGVTGVGAYEIENITETLTIDGQSYTASGILARDFDTDVWASEFYILWLDDGTRIDYGSMKGTQAEFQKVEETLRQIATSLQVREASSASSSLPSSLTFPDYDCPVTTTTAVPSTPAAPTNVFYVRADGIYRWQEATGESDLIFPASDVHVLKLSDDGQRLAFIRQKEVDASEGMALWVMDSDGKNGRELLSPADFRTLYAETDEMVLQPWLITWQPYSHTLAFSAVRYNIVAGYLEGITAHRYDDLHLIDADSGDTTTLLPPGAGGDFFYAPDGAQIALVNDTGLSLVNSDGSNLRSNILTWEPLGITHEYHRPPPAWLPTSKTLLIAPSNATDNIDADYNPDASSTIWRVPVEGKPQSLTTMVGAPLWLAFSPDGNQVAFMRTIHEPYTRDLHIAAVDNAWNIVYARDEGADFRGWLPDSSGFVLGVNREAPLLGRLCQPSVPLPLPATPGSFVRYIEWIDDSRFLFTIDEPPQLLLGNLDGNTEQIGSLRPEYFFGVGALAAFDFSLDE